METGTKAGRVRSLVVELGARTAIIDGTRVELPPTEFSLLAVLAARPGEVIEHKQLLTEAFGSGSYLTDTDLHWRIWNIRKLLGDSQRTLIRNRRGVGFLLALATDAVEVMEGVAPPVKEEPESVIRLDEPEPAPTHPAEISASPALDSDPQPDAEPVSRPRRLTYRPRSLLVAGLIAILALAASWLAGYGLSQLRSSGSEVAAAPQQQAPEPPDDPGEDGDPNDSGKNGKDRKKGRDRGTRGEDGVVVAGTSGSPSTQSAGTASGTSEQRGGSQNGSAEAKKPAPPPPPQPDAQLYHLFDPDGGDHFVTTSSSLANQKQAEGYDSTTEGRVFSAQQKGTTPITLDAGTAYVYRSRDAAPHGVSVAELYRLTNGGDFFYTSSSSVANQAEAQGWDRSVSGFVQ